MLAFACLIAAAVSLDDLDYEFVRNSRANDTDDLATSACGFLVFLAIMVMLIEGTIIALRFLNFGIVNKFITIFHIVVCVAFFLLPIRYMH